MSTQSYIYIYIYTLYQWYWSQFISKIPNSVINIYIYIYIQTRLRWRTEAILNYFLRWCFVSFKICLLYNKQTSVEHFQESSAMTQFTPLESWRWHIVMIGVHTRSIQQKKFRMFEDSAENSKSRMNLKVIMKIQQLGSLTLVVLMRKELPNLLVRSRPWLSTILANQVYSRCHRSVRVVDIRYFSYKTRKEQLYHSPWGTRRKLSWKSFQIQASPPTEGA